MLCGSALDAGPPHAPGRWLHFASHKFNNLLFRQAKLGFYGIKGRPILPGHFNNTVYINVRQVIHGCRYFHAGKTH